MIFLKTELYKRQGPFTAKARGTRGRDEKFSALFRTSQVVHHPLDAVLHARDIPIEDKPQFALLHFEIGQQLSFMYLSAEAAPRFYAR
jgi:hypothetical protein